MATLHMDVEQVQATQQKIVSEKETMLNELNTLTNQNQLNRGLVLGGIQPPNFNRHTSNCAIKSTSS